MISTMESNRKKKQTAYSAQTRSGRVFRRFPDGGKRAVPPRNDRRAAFAAHPLTKAAAAFFALGVWQAAAMLLNQRLLLASPVEVAVRLCSLLTEEGFAASLLFSFSRIVLGFLSALVLGTALAVLAGRFPLVETLLRPFMLTVKSVPVASFIILALIWLSSRQLSTFISFLMVLPVIYTGVLGGIHAVDPKLTEAAGLFRVPWGRRLYYVWTPQIRPYLFSACSVSLGLSWKAGIAAEVIGIPSGSIGEALYDAKVYLDTASLFAWTVVIVLLSLIFEKLFLALLRILFDGLLSGSARRERRMAKAETSCADEPAVSDMERETSEDIALERVDKAFGENEVLRSFSARISAGRTTCLMGASGVGKTTLVHLLLGLLKPDAGFISGLPARRTAVFQENRLCEAFSAAANIRFAVGKALPAGEPYRCLRLLGLDADSDVPVQDYSGGMKRRVALARALLAPGDLLVLDEPFKGLDADTRLLAAAAVRKYAAGKTVVLVSHDPEEAELLDASVIRLGADEQALSPERGKKSPSV